MGRTRNTQASTLMSPWIDAEGRTTEKTRCGSSEKVPCSHGETLLRTDSTYIIVPMKQVLQAQIGSTKLATHMSSRSWNHWSYGPHRKRWIWTTNCSLHKCAHACMCYSCLYKGVYACMCMVVYDINVYMHACGTYSKKSSTLMKFRSLGMSDNWAPKLVRWLQLKQSTQVINMKSQNRRCHCDITKHVCHDEIKTHFERASWVELSEYKFIKYFWSC